MDKPDVCCVGDLTYIRTGRGWLYLAVILDLFSRKVIRWSMAKTMETRTVLNALDMALGSRTPDETGMVSHSGRGSQYTSNAHRKVLVKHAITAMA